MPRGQYNILVIRNKEKPYILRGAFIATKLSKAQFEKAKEVWADKLGEYDFIAYKDTDFTWWRNVTRKLCYSEATCTYRLREAYFDIDWFGNVKEY